MGEVLLPIQTSLENVLSMSVQGLPLYLLLNSCVAEGEKVLRACLTLYVMVEMCWDSHIVVMVAVKSGVLPIKAASTWKLITPHIKCLGVFQHHTIQETFFVSLVWETDGHQGTSRISILSISPNLLVQILFLGSLGRETEALWMTAFCALVWTGVALNIQAVKND